MGRVDLPPPETHETGYPPPTENELVVTIERDWTVEEEKKAKRKYEALHICLSENDLTRQLGLTFLSCPCSHWASSASVSTQCRDIHSANTNNMQELDRGNMANAITDDFMEDIGITQDQFNVGQQMLSLGIVLFEIPSNMILYRVGPGKWLTLQLFLLVSLGLSMM